MNKIKLTIGRRLSIGFGVIILAVLTSSVLTFITFSKSKELNNKISNIYMPSLGALQELNILITNSKMLVGNWIFIQSNDDTPDKNKLRDLHTLQFPLLKTKIMDISKMWEPKEREMLTHLFLSIDTLFETQKSVMTRLNSFESYDDPMTVFEIRPMMEQEGAIVMQSNKIFSKLEVLIFTQEQYLDNVTKQMSSSFNSFNSFIIIMGLILMIAGVFIAFFTTKSITSPVINLRNVLLTMGEGKLPENKINEGKDEIGEMAAALNILIDGLREKASFSQEIGNGNFKYDFHPLSDDDILGNALIFMRKSLQTAEDEEKKRKIEDEKRNWATQGLAKFAEILRQNNDNMEVLSFNIIQNLVKYLKANQGGLFILNDDNKEEVFVELTACYAFDRKKFLEKKIHSGEGLVGACLQEGETIFLTDVPDSYISITSGLGDSNPRCILIVPLKLNDEIFGVIELASFVPFEPYEVEFVEKIGESIASTISSVKINIRTAYLLEQSQKQREEMRTQEEEMRQNLEEMHATQEEMARKESEYKGMFDVFNKNLGIIELNLDGTIKKSNDVFCRIIGFRETELIGTNFSNYLNADYKNSQEYKAMWEILAAGNNTDECESHVIAKDGNEVNIKGAFSPILNFEGYPYKIIHILYEV